MRGITVLVLRADGQFSKMPGEYGCEVTNLELIRTEPISDLNEIAKVIHKIEI